MADDSITTGRSADKCARALSFSKEPGISIKERERRKFLRCLAGRSVGLSAGVAAAPWAFSESKPGEHVSSKRNSANYVVSVLEFGAIGDGRTLCTTAIQAAVDACSRAGGGKVFVPPGKYLMGPIFLRSNLELEILAGATLVGSANFADYPTIQGWWEGLQRTIYASLITGIGVENVSVTGRGILDGRGAAWRDAWEKTEELRKRLGLVGREPESPPGSPLPWPRPRMINLYRSRNVLISGLIIRDSPSWTVHPVLCEDVCIERLTILNPQHSPNTDGIDPESCRNVRISDCYISTGDDCIMIKSGYKQIPGKPFAPSENIVVTNCVFNYGGCGVGIGSETAGGVRNIAIGNCVCDGTDCGLYLRTARGRGNVMENVSAVNFVMRGILESAIVVSMFYEDEDRTTMRPVNESTPTIGDFHCRDITVDGAKQAALIEGLPENPIRGLSLDNLFVKTARRGISCSQVHGFSLSNAVVNAERGPAAEFKNIHQLELIRLRGSKTEPNTPLIELQQVQDAVVQSCSAAGNRPALLRLNGRGNGEITLALNRVSKQGKELVFTNGASEEAVIKRS